MAQTHLLTVQVVVETKHHSTFIVLWKALGARIAAHSAKKRAEDEARMSERSSRGSSGLSTPVRACLATLSQALLRPSA